MRVTLAHPIHQAESSSTEGILCFPVHNQTQIYVVLSNNRAMSLEGIAGRAVWQTPQTEKIVQTPFLSNEKILKFIEKEKDHGKSDQGVAVTNAEGARGSTVSQESSASEEVTDQLPH